MAGFVGKILGKLVADFKPQIVFILLHTAITEMKNPVYVWMDGKFKIMEEAKVSIMSHSFHHGSAVFEGIRFYAAEKGTAIFRLNDHIDRFFYSASFLGINLRYSKDEMASAIINTIRKNKLKEGYARPIAYYDSSSSGGVEVTPFNCPVKVAIAVWEWKHSLKNKLLKVKISPYRRISPKSADINAKISGYYYNSVIAGIDARKSGYDEAFMLDDEGYVAEATSENIFAVKNGVLFTPKKGSILPGITRDSVIILAKGIGIEVCEKNISVNELKNSDEVFLTATAAEIIAVGSIDEKLISKKEGKITSKLKKLFHLATRGKLIKYRKWIVYI